MLFSCLKWSVLNEILSNKSESFLKISLVKTENLPEGDYDCEIYVKKSKKNNLVDRGIVDNEIVVSSISSIKVTKRVHEFKDKDFLLQVLSS